MSALLSQYIQNLSTVQKVYCNDFLTVTLPPLFPHRNESSKLAARRSYRALTWWPLWHFTPHCHFSLLFFECDNKMIYLSQDLYLLLLLPRNFFAHGLQILCCQVNVKYDLIRSLPQEYNQNTLSIIINFFFFLEPITSDNLTFIS